MRKQIPLMAPWASPGHVLVALGSLLGAFQAFLDALGALLGALGTLLETLERLLDASWTQLRPILEKIKKRSFFLDPT